MKKLFNLTAMATLLAAMALFSGCSDEIVQPETKSTGGELLSRGAYDYPPVEWDNVKEIKVECALISSKKTLSVPWAEGETDKTGIPSSWIDHNYMNPDPKKRAYSRENGWEMVFHNLSDATQECKYFGLYNKISGVLRMFFYEMSVSSSLGSSSTWESFNIYGSSSLLNFTDKYPSPMNDRKNYPVFNTTPQGKISTKSIENVSYQPNKWYGMEVELAYDSYATSSNKIYVKVWGQFLTSASISGINSGEIQGRIKTTESGSSSRSTASTELDATIGLDATMAKQELQARANKGGTFFTNLWNSIKSGHPSLVNKSASDGIAEMMDNGDADKIRDLSQIISMSGRSASSTTNTVSTVDLGLNTKITLSQNSSTNVGGWGDISNFNLPQFAANNQCYSGRLGVWNLQDYPKVTVDLLATSMFYPKELIPNPSSPRASYPTYTYSLSYADLVVNPELLANYKVERHTQRLVYTTNAGNRLGTLGSGYPYGIFGNIEYYRPSGGSLKITGMLDEIIRNWNPSNPESTYSMYWMNIYEPAKYNHIMCHVYFELVSKTNSNDRYAYSKYFPVKIVKGKFSHREETITQ